MTLVLQSRSSPCSSLFASCAGGLVSVFGQQWLPFLALPSTGVIECHGKMQLHT